MCSLSLSLSLSLTKVAWLCDGTELKSILFVVLPTCTSHFCMSFSHYAHHTSACRFPIMEITVLHAMYVTVSCVHDIGGQHTCTDYI